MTSGDKQSRRLGMRQSAVERHPQRQLIVDALLAGESVRRIESWTIPPVGRMALQRYRAQHVVPALRHAATNTRPHARSPIQRAVREATDRAEAIESGRAEIQHSGVLAVRESRIALLEDRHRRMRSVIEERALATSRFPGDRSGLLDADGKLDRGLLAEMREAERQAAVELGQWNESAAANFAIQIVMPGGPVEAVPREASAVDIAIVKR